MLLHLKVKAITVVPLRLVSTCFCFVPPTHPFSLISFLFGGLTSPRCGRRRCKPPTSRVLYSPLSSEATLNNMCHVHWGFRLLFVCRARYCIRPTAARTLEHEETYSCCLWLSENFGLKGFGCSRSLCNECVF